MLILLSDLSDKQNTRGSGLSKPVEMGKEYTVDVTDTALSWRWHYKNKWLCNFRKKRKSRGQKLVVDSLMQ